MNDDQKKILGIVVTVVLVILAIYFLKDDNNPKKIHYAYTISTTEIENCIDEASLIYRDEASDINYYTYCLSEVGIRGEVVNDSLVNSFAKGVTINDVMKYLKLDLTLKDGGTKVFSDDGFTGYTNNGLVVISCNRITPMAENTVVTTKDYYIGPKTLEVLPGFCVRKELCSFTRTFNVVNIVNNIETGFKDVTLMSSKNEQITTKINETMLTNVVIGNNIEIKFTSDYYTDENTSLNEVFRNAIVSINVTDKQGLDQINEVFCSN